MKPKFLGAFLHPDDVRRIEDEMSRRLGRGEGASRAELIREAIQKTYPLPDSIAPAAQQKDTTHEAGHHVHA